MATCVLRIYAGHTTSTQSKQLVKVSYVPLGRFEKCFLMAAVRLNSCNLHWIRNLLKKHTKTAK